MSLFSDSDSEMWCHYCEEFKPISIWELHIKQHRKASSSEDESNYKSDVSETFADESDVSEIENDHETVSVFSERDRSHSVIFSGNESDDRSSELAESNNKSDVSAVENDKKSEFILKQDRKDGSSETKISTGESDVSEIENNHQTVSVFSQRDRYGYNFFSGNESDDSSDSDTGVSCHLCEIHFPSFKQFTRHILQHQRENCEEPSDLAEIEHLLQSDVGEVDSEEESMPTVPQSNTDKQDNKPKQDNNDSRLWCHTCKITIPTLKEFEQHIKQHRKNNCSEEETSHDESAAVENSTAFSVVKSPAETKLDNNTAAFTVASPGDIKLEDESPFPQVIPPAEIKVEDYTAKDSLLILPEEIKVEDNAETPMAILPEEIKVEDNAETPIAILPEEIKVEDNAKTPTAILPEEIKVEDNAETRMAILNEEIKLEDNTDPIVTSPREIRPERNTPLPASTAESKSDVKTVSLRKPLKKKTYGDILLKQRKNKKKKSTANVSVSRKRKSSTSTNNEHKKKKKTCGVKILPKDTLCASAIQKDILEPSQSDKADHSKSSFNYEVSNDANLPNIPGNTLANPINNNKKKKKTCGVKILPKDTCASAIQKDILEPSQSDKADHSKSSFNYEVSNDANLPNIPGNTLANPINNFINSQPVSNNSSVYHAYSQNASSNTFVHPIHNFINHQPVFYNNPVHHANLQNMLNNNFGNPINNSFNSQPASINSPSYLVTPYGIFLVQPVQTMPFQNVNQ